MLTTGCFKRKLGGVFKAWKLSCNFTCSLSSKLHENNIVLLRRSFYINRRLLKNTLITEINKEIIKITPGGTKSLILQNVNSMMIF